jgi:glucose/arabinose dehydrogenase
MKDIFVSDEGAGGVARLAFDRTNHLYVTTGGAGAQDANSQQGKVLRLMDDGTVPKDNPFVGRADAKPQVFTMGHRNSLGLAMNPTTGEMWQNENGPNGGDEINVLVAGKNYGWPKVSYGRNYQGPWQTEVPGHVGFEPPIVYWVPAIAASGMTFYTGNKLPKWKGDVFVGSMRTGENSRHRPRRARPVQREVRGTAPRAAARRAAPARARHPHGPGRTALRADGREARRRAPDRAQRNRPIVITIRDS